MSSLPNSKSSFLHAARNCSALALAGAMVLPMTPVLAQDAAPAANAPVANAPTANTPATQNVALSRLSPLIMGSTTSWTDVTSSGKERRPVHR